MWWLVVCVLLCLLYNWESWTFFIVIPSSVSSSATCQRAHTSNSNHDKGVPGKGRPDSPFQVLLRDEICTEVQDKSGRPRRVSRYLRRLFRPTENRSIDKTIESRSTEDQEQHEHHTNKRSPRISSTKSDSMFQNSSHLDFLGVLDKTCLELPTQVEAHCDRSRCSSIVGMSAELFALWLQLPDTPQSLFDARPIGDEDTSSADFPTEDDDIDVAALSLTPPDHPPIGYEVRMRSFATFTWEKYGCSWRAWHGGWYVLVFVYSWGWYVLDKLLLRRLAALLCRCTNRPSDGGSRGGSGGTTSVLDKLLRSCSRPVGDGDCVNSDVLDGDFLAFATLFSQTLDPEHRDAIQDMLTIGRAAEAAAAGGSVEQAAVEAAEAGVVEAGGIAEARVAEAGGVAGAGVAEAGEVAEAGGVAETVPVVAETESE